MRDILQEIKDGTYEVSPTRLKRIEDNPIDFLDTSFKGNFYTRRGSAFEELLTEGKLTSFDVIEGEEPDPNSKIWTVIEPLAGLVLDGYTIEEGFEEAVSKSSYKVSPSTIKKYFNPYRDWFSGYIESTMSGRETITRDTFEIITKMANNYNKVPFLKGLLDGDLQFKVQFEHQGWKCKGFLDRWDPEDGILVDFKTTQRDYRVVPIEQRYDIQGSFYKTGLEKMGYEVKRVIFVICSTKPPYKPKIIEFNDRDLEVGKKGGLAYKLITEKAYGRNVQRLSLEEVLGFEQLLDRLSWHVENGFEAKYENDFINSNLYL